MFKQKRIWILCLLPVSFIILIIVKHYPAVAEYVFARGLYRFAGGFLALVTNWLPFSLAELGIVLIPFAILTILVVFIRKMIKNKENHKFLLYKGILNVACLGTMIFFFLTVMCLVNTHRYSFAKQSGLEVKESSVEELYQMCLDLADKANEAKSHVNTDEAGAMSSLMSYKEIVKEANRSYQKISKQYPTLGNISGNAKPVFFSRAMSYTGIIGLYVPYTMEANVDIDITDYSIPNTMCHELAHLQGYPLEDEANYIAYLVCINSDNWEFKYSGYMLAAITSMNELYSVDADLYGKVYEKLSESVIADLTSNHKYWAAIEKKKAGQKVEQVVNILNDNYLKLSGQEHGMQTYGLVVDLLLAEYRKK